MVYAINQASARVLQRLASARRFSSLKPLYSNGWHESADRKKGIIEVNWGKPESWDETILQGPNLFVLNAFYKSPNSTMSSNKDWSVVDLEELPSSATPTTVFKREVDREVYDSSYTHWGSERVPARSKYRIAWRSMAATSNERTLISSVIPPGTAHVHAVLSCALSDDRAIALAAGTLGSLISDFFVRSIRPSTISQSVMSSMPIPGVRQSAIARAISLRALRLSSLTDAYSDLWSQTWLPEFAADTWTGGVEWEGRPELGDVQLKWTEKTPLRRASDRRQALVEIDALVALAFDVSIDELCTVYRTQFAVLHGYDRRSYIYDANGRLVPTSVLTAWRAKGDRMVEADLIATNASGKTQAYKLPFRVLEREEDMRQAYAFFEQLLQERS